MDIEKEFSCLENNDLVFHKLIDCDFDCQETLQQYSDDIIRVVKCDSCSQISAVRINSNGIEIEGKTEIFITYYNDNNELCYVDFDTDFNKKVNISNLSEKSFAYIIPNTRYNNYRLVNQRRVDIHISLSLDVRVFDFVSSPCLSSCDNSKLKIENINSANIYSTCNTKADFDEEFSVSSSSKPIKRIISHNANIVVGDSKIIKDKALIKLNVSICVLYTTDDNNEEIEKVEHTFDLSKIIDVNGLCEDDIIITNADISSIFVKAKNSSSNSINEVEVYGDIALTSILIKKKEISIVTDGYLVGRKCNCVYNKMCCITDYNRICDDFNESLLLKFNSEFKEIYDLSLKPIKISCHNTNLVFTLCVKALCKSLDGSICYISTESEFVVDTTMAFDGAIANCCVLSFDYNIESNCEVKVRLSFKLDAFLFNKSVLDVLTEIEEKDSSIQTPALTLYFGKKNESIWEIAKQFSSDIQLIKQENSLSLDILENNKVLMIPGI